MIAVLQAFIEERLEGVERSDLEITQSAQVSSAYRPVLDAVVQKRAGGRIVERRVVVIVVGSTLLWAELMHGFGSDLYVWVWGRTEIDGASCSSRVDEKHVDGGNLSTHRLMITPHPIDQAGQQTRARVDAAKHAAALERLKVVLLEGN